MSAIDTPVDMLEPVEDVGGAAQPLLQVNGLTKHFPVRGGLFSARKTVRAVDDVSFSIAKGETLGIVGKSGCGKSTTARLLMHLMKRDAGDIVYDGMRSARALSLRELRRGMQMVFQDSYASLNPRLTIEESIAFGPKVHGMADGAARALARDLLGKVGLRPENFRQSLSARDFRRPAPARQHRARAGTVAAARDPRRGGVGARQIGRGAGAQSAGRSQARIRTDLSLHQPRSQRGALHQRSRAGDVSRRGGRARSGRQVWDAPAHPYTRALLAAMPSSDPDHRTETPPISGDPPNPIDPPSGLPVSHPLSVRRAALRKRHAKTHRDSILWGTGGVLHGHPGSGHSRAPAKTYTSKEETRHDQDPAEGNQAMAAVAGVPVDAEVAARIANSIGPAFEALPRSPARCRSTWSLRASCSRRPRRCRNEQRARPDVADRGRQGDRRQESVVARSHAILPQSRSRSGSPSSTPSWRSRADDALAAADAGRRGIGERQRSRRAAWRAAGAQGHVLRRGQGRDLRLQDPPRFRRHHDLDRAAAAEGRRPDSARLAADGGIRLWADRPQRALRRGA